MQKRRLFYRGQSNRGPRKRGIVLLIVLSLLAMFVIIAVTYTVVATMHRRTAIAVAQDRLFDEHPSELIDTAFYQVFRDTLDPNSPFRGHSLLRDFYGDDYVNAGGSLQVASTPTSVAGQFLQFNVGPAASFPSGLPPDYFAGCVVTFLSGDAKGISCRIVHSDYSTAPSPSPGPYIRVMRPSTVGNSLATVALEDRILINGRPFNGTGFGFTSTSTGGRSLTVQALRPNRLGDTATALETFLTGGADEGYDIADHQNMALAAIVPVEVDDAGTPSFDERNNVDFVVPSFHRPRLAATQAATASEVDYSLRPVDGVHANGSFPAIDLVNGPWDVDNDGDGVADSIWVDIGLPVKTDKSGRRYKPLFAVMCLDMDGRFNVNAAGILPPGDRNAGAIATVQPIRFARDNANSANSNAIPSYLRNHGYGPWEVSLRRFFNSQAEYEQLFYGKDPLPGRYGSGALVHPGTDRSTPDDFALLKHYRDPTQIVQGQLRHYGSPPNFHGEIALAVAESGQPVSEGRVGTDLRANVPWEMSPRAGVFGAPSGASGSAPSPTSDRTDDPFTEHDLESLLRYNDFDLAALSQRLLEIMPEAKASLWKRRLLTTRSSDLPTPHVITSPGSRDDFTTYPKGRPLHVMDLLRAQGVANDQMTLLLDYDVIRGMRMDINRLFGDGLDGDGDGIVDESDEQDTSGPNVAERIWSSTGISHLSNNGYRINHTNGVNVNLDSVVDDEDRQLARQLFARHLYVLILALNPDGTYDYDGNGTASAVEFKRQAAQWAVNVVDFRDSDSINTGFEYDEDPFDGWNVDGDLATTEGAFRKVVWGVERPELLLSETIATHDRRTEDLEFTDDKGTADTDDDEENKKTTDPMRPDDDFDQRLVPKGMLVIELFNPWASAIPASPAELYGNDGGVRLDRRTGQGLSGTPADRDSGDPVWRVIVVEGAGGIGADPDNPDAANSLQDVNIERRIYFVNSGDIPTPLRTEDGVFSTTMTTTRPIGPGGYAVIAPDGYRHEVDSSAAGVEHVLPFGRTANAMEGPVTNLDLANTRSIVLNVDNHKVRVRNNGNPSDPAAATEDSYYRDVSVVIVDNPSLNVSEPVDGYDAPETPADPINKPDGEYDPIRDEPLDKGREGGDLEKDQTLLQFRELHLQRLADPTLSYNEDSNPYLTIDSTTVDLTVFNGVTNDTDPDANGGNNTDFRTKQRGDGGPAPNAQDGRALWAQTVPTAAVTMDSPTDGSNPGEGHFFKHYLMKHSIGYLNTPYGRPFTAGAWRGYPDLGNTLNYTDAPYPFPWLVWNNRPYISELELLQVPARHSARMLKEFTLADSSVNPTSSRLSPFGHLANFFHSTGTGADSPAHLHRILDFLHVPSHYVGTETFLNPETFQLEADGTIPAGLEGFLPPFNRVSNYQDPGKINLNTLQSPEGLATLLGVPSTGAAFQAFWTSFKSSRYGPATAPVRFSAPFRSSNAADLVPPGITAPSGADCTLLRVSGTNRALLANPMSRDIRSHTERNSFFHFHELQRLGNLTTTRSNVYAIWITVGYFEVDGAGLLGEEIGTSDGRIERNRGFYLVDRSIPVAFEPGQTHNVDRAVLVRRMIE